VGQHTVLALVTNAKHSTIIFPVDILIGDPFTQQSYHSRHKTPGKTQLLRAACSIHNQTFATCSCSTFPMHHAEHKGCRAAAYVTQTLFNVRVLDTLNMLTHQAVPPGAAQDN
jgi:hypothetical protein